jgi:hypothetical protein
MRLRATLFVVLVMAIGLLAYSPTVMATHLGGNTGHSDTQTLNGSGSLGLKGSQFVTLFTIIECDPPGPADCSGHALEAVSAWLAGQWWDPRGGTAFIPPTGDHHRAGWSWRSAGSGLREVLDRHRSVRR